MNKYKLFLICFPLCFFCSSCTQNYIGVRKIPIDKTSYAFYYAETPDPRANNPPKGEKLYITYRVPFSHNPKEMTVKLNVVYKDLSQEELIYPVERRIGVIGLGVIGDQFKEKKGFFTYKVSLLDSEGEAVDSFKQRMWTKVINLSDKQESI